MSWFSRKNTQRDASSDAKQCSFCGTPRQDVAFLVAKDARTAICEGCVALAIAVMDQDPNRNVDRPYLALALAHVELIEAAQPAHWLQLPTLARGLLALRSTPAQDLLRLAQLCSLRNHDDAKAAALLLFADVVNIAEFRPQDAVQMGYTAYDLGDFTAVRRAGSIFTSSNLIDDAIMLDLAALTLLADAAEQRDGIDAALATRAQQLLELANAVGGAAETSRVQCIVAWVLHRHGHHRSAIDLYQAVKVQHGLLPRSEVPFGDACNAAGDGAAAVAAWQSVRAATAATNFWHREATARLDPTTAIYR
ncbi:MAG TPA: ClpX C4-type zinc finger protein [Kofleriaceae bacterium]|nr:ClpX C4-type zinc finger protein [Kofleriaceae bacterium]